MKNAILSSFVLMVIVGVLGINIYFSKKDINNLITLNKQIESIVFLDNEINTFIQQGNDYINFDIVEQKISKLKKNFKDISFSETLYYLKNEQISKDLKLLDKNLQKKIHLVQDVKSINAIITNSFRFVPKIKEQISSQELNKIYTMILTIDHVDTIDLDKEIKNVKKIKTNNKYENIFLNHARIVLEKTKDFHEVKRKIKELNLEKKLRDFLFDYEKIAQASINKAQTSIIILFLILAVFIAAYLIYSYKIIYRSIQFERFKKSVEGSDNIIVVTDENEFIKYVNEAFTRTTGYTKEEAIGRRPSFLKSNQHSEEFYRNLHDTIHSGKKWNGEFVNRAKNGDLSYEKASITPVLDNSGEIVEFIALKLDITKDILMQRELESKKEQLKQQSKMAAMGEMLENIAHQWRQPLSIISTAVTGLQAQKEFGEVVDKKTEMKTLEVINDTVQQLSQTITDFRDFFKPDTAKSYFNLKDIYLKTFKTIEQKLKDDQIWVIEELQDVEILSFKNEMIQVLMNILNNAKDALEDKKIAKKLLFVYIESSGDNVTIKIRDNAGGIPEKIMEKIFEPYFTTKHKFQGTGIGLYMSKEMLEKHMEGSIVINNKEYLYEGKTYKGAEVVITLPRITKLS